MLFKDLFFSSLFVLFIEGYMEFCIAGYLHWIGHQYRTEMVWGERISQVVSIWCSFVAIVFLPCCFVYMLTRDKEVVKSLKFEERFGMLYHGLKINDKW